MAKEEVAPVYRQSTVAFHRWIIVADCIIDAKTKVERPSTLASRLCLCCVMIGVRCLQIRRLDSVDLNNDDART